MQNNSIYFNYFAIFMVSLFIDKYCGFIDVENKQKKANEKIVKRFYEVK